MIEDVAMIDILSRSLFEEVHAVLISFRYSLQMLAIVWASIVCFLRLRKRCKLLLMFSNLCIILLLHYHHFFLFIILSIVNIVIFVVVVWWCRPHPVREHAQDLRPPLGARPASPPTCQAAQLPPRGPSTNPRPLV